MTSDPRQAPFSLIAADVEFAKEVEVVGFVNLYGCRIGKGTTIGPFVEIQRGAAVGERCKVSSHSFICSGVTIEDECFVGHHVVFINDRYPRATTRSGQVQGESDWELVETRVAKGASIGSGSVILCGLTIGESALVGAGSVVTTDVRPGAVVAGNPAVELARGMD